MYPAVHAHNTPDSSAFIMGSGDTGTYRQLNDRSSQCAQLFASLGLVKDDALALFVEICQAQVVVSWELREVARSILDPGQSFKRTIRGRYWQGRDSAII